MAERLRALRGATTLDADTRDQVIERTATLLKTMIERNQIDKSTIVSIVFTATGDVHSEFPAAAARQLGISDVPLLCARELDVTDAIGLCVRVRELTPAAGERHAYLIEYPLAPPVQM